MAQAAKEARASTTVELEEAIRQAKRYLASHEPSTRIIEQRIKRIREVEAEFKRYHFVYCGKANIEIDSKEQMDYLQAKLDNSVDAIDECMAFIEDKERQQRDREDEISTESLKQEEKRKSETRYQNCIAELSLDERMAKDLCQKINILAHEELYTTGNAVTMEAHLDGLNNLQKALHQSWRELIYLLEGQGESQKVADDVFASRSHIQVTVTTAVLFLDMCKREELKNSSPTFDTTSGESKRPGLIKDSNIKAEKMKMPTFSGNIRTFAKFKKDFAKIAAPLYPDEF